MKWQLYKTQLRDGLIRSLTLLVLIALLFIMQNTIVGGIAMLGLYGMFVSDFVQTIKELASRKYKLYGLVPVSSLHYIVPMLLRYLITTFLAIFLAYTVTFSIIPNSAIDLSQYHYLFPYVSLAIAFSLMYSVLLITAIILLARSTLVSGVQVAFIRIISVIIIGFFTNYVVSEIINTMFGYGGGSVQYILSRTIFGSFDTGVILTLTAATFAFSLLYTGIIFLLREKYLDY